MEELTIISFKIDKGLKEAFEKAAAAEDLTVSQILRGFVREYLRKREQKASGGTKKRGR
jgi:antitoxin component of RelBE/YafQ-DinJ toxin-antitoxin module